MRTVTIVVIVLALAIIGAFMLASQRARVFMQEKKKRHGRHPFVKLPGPGTPGKRARKE